MSRLETISFAVATIMVVAACGNAAAAQANNPQKRRTSPANASASFNPATVTNGRYDSGCRATAAKGSHDYNACLQKLPASALTGGGGY